MDVRRRPPTLVCRLVREKSKYRASEHQGISIASVAWYQDAASSRDHKEGCGVVDVDPSSALLSRGTTPACGTHVRLLNARAGFDCCLAGFCSVSKVVLSLDVAAGRGDDHLEQS